MTIAIQPCHNSDRSYVLENGFKYDFPAPITQELIRYLEGRHCSTQEFSMGEWVLSLPLGKRMTVGIQLINRNNQ